jgi:hypothetical protein
MVFNSAFKGLNNFRIKPSNRPIYLPGHIFPFLGDQVNLINPCNLTNNNNNNNNNNNAVEITTRI